MAKVSVIIPLYNRRDLFRETLVSVQNQTHIDFECIVIDDGSTDGSLEAAQKCVEGDSRFIIMKRVSMMRGACVCRNEGMERASGEYLMFLDSDDILASECIKNRVEIISRQMSCDFTVHQIGIFRHESFIVKQLWSALNHADDLVAFVYSEGWALPNTFFRKDYVMRFRFDENALSYQDVDFHIRILLDAPYYVKYPDAMPDVFVRVSSFERISTRNMSYERIASRIRLYRKLEDLMEAKGFKEYLYPYMVYNFRFLEMAARLLSESEFIDLHSMWRGTRTFEHSKKGFYNEYLFLQVRLRKMSLRLFASIIYRIPRIFIAKGLVKGGSRLVRLPSPIDISNHKLVN